MKKSIKKQISGLKQSLRHSTEFKKIKPLLRDPCYWSYSHQTVARGVAAGLAGSVIPGFQILYAGILVFLLRGNVTVALLSTLITNPLTVVPVTWFIYFVGNLILENGYKQTPIRPLEWDFTSVHAFWGNVHTWLFQFGKAYLAGLPLVSVCFGIFGYFGVIAFWNIAIFFRNIKK